MAYSFTPQTKKFHVTNTPKKFSYPVYILLKTRENFLRVKDEEYLKNKYLISQYYDENFENLMSYVKVYGNVSDLGDEFLRKNYKCYFLQGCFITQINNDNEFETPKKEDNLDIEETFLNWNFDDKNPVYDIHPIGIDFYCVYHKFCPENEEISIEKNEIKKPKIETFFPVFCGPSVKGITFVNKNFYLEIEEKFTKKIQLNFKENYFDFEKSIINMKFLPKVVRIWEIFTKKTTQEIHHFELDFQEILSLYSRILKTNDVNQTKALNFFSERQRKLEEKFPMKINQKEEENSQKIFKIYETKNAVCEAFENKTVKLKFSDRTIVTLIPKENKADIITRYGDFLNNIKIDNPGPHLPYINTCIEFWKFVFIPVKEREREEEEEMRFQSMVKGVLERSKDLVDLMNGRKIQEEKKVQDENFYGGSGEFQDFSEIRTEISRDFEEGENEEGDLQDRINALLKESGLALKDMRNALDE